MSKIGIYKPFKTVFFGNSDTETAAWSYEVVNLISIFEENGHEVVLLSPSVGRHFNVKSYDIFDRIIVVGGAFTMDPEGETALHRLRHKTGRLDFLLTDQKLSPRSRASWELFDNIYTQSTKKDLLFMDGPVALDLNLKSSTNVFRSYSEELVLYGCEQPKYNLFTKTTDFYFGGGERGRSKSFFEFVYRPDHVLRIKSESLLIDNRVSFATHTQLLSSAMTTIVIADVDYNRTGFVTPRQYEAWLVDTIAFCERGYDPLGKIFPLDSWLRVDSFTEMRAKTLQIKQQPLMRQNFIDWQRSHITAQTCAGENVYKSMR